MHISYVFGEKPCYFIDSDDLKEFNAKYKDRAPFGFQHTYTPETLMYAFLDSNLVISSVKRVFTYTSKDYSDSCFVFEVDYIDHEDLAVYLIPFEDDLPS